MVTTAADLIDRYDGFLIDAYGVLVTSRGGLPHAAEFLAALRAADKPFVVVTNDASRSREHSMRSYRRRGIDVPEQLIITSGSLLTDAGIDGRTCTVLGTPDAANYAVEAGAKLVDFGEDAEVVVAGDEAGYDFLEAVDATMSMIVRRVRAGLVTRLLLPNPDVVYPKGEGELGMASGAVAAMIEAALVATVGENAPKFEPLGKPHAPIFEKGLALLGTSRDKTVMLGDQLDTDIRGALNVGIAAALVLTGVGRARSTQIEPTNVLHGLGPTGE